MRKIPSTIQSIALSILVSISTDAAAVTLGQIDDFEDSTTQNWTEGGASSNPPTNEAGGPAGSTRYLSNVSSGAICCGGTKMTMFNDSQWSGDYISAGITEVHAMVRVDPSSASALSLRVGFREATQGGQLGFGSVAPVVVPNDGTWYDVTFPIGPGDLAPYGGTGLTYEETLSNVGQFRIYHSEEQSWQGQPIAATMGIDDISAEAADSGTHYQGWLWETSTYSDEFTVEEENCFGQVDLLVNGDMTWDYAGTDEVCRGRNTGPNYRTLYNSPPYTTDEFHVDGSTPIQSAGGNLYEMYGEIIGDGQGVQRLATTLLEPDGQDLAIVGSYTPTDLPGDHEGLGFIHLLAKSTPAIKDVRTAADLANTTWRIGMALHATNTSDVNVESSLAGVLTLQLQSAGACSYVPSAVFPDLVKNRDLYGATQFSAGTDLDDRGVQAGLNGAELSGCTYSIDADGYLAVSSTLTLDSDPNNPIALDWRFVVSDDNEYLVLAPAAAGVDGNSQLLLAGYRAASGLAADAIDGNYLFYLVLSEYDATGTYHSLGETGRQEYDFRGRGMFSFDSTTLGTVPDGESGTWYGCAASLVVDGVELGYTGDYGVGDVLVDGEISAEKLDFDTCDYRLDADGALSIHLTDVLPDEPQPIDLILRGYVNANGDVVALAAVATDPDPTTVPAPEDSGSVYFVLGMQYSGDPNADDDGDEVSNSDEFMSPIPQSSTIPILLRRTSNGRWYGYNVEGDAIVSEGGVNLTDNLAWQVESVADFDGNRTDDVLLRRTDNLRWYLYLMNGTNIIEEGGVGLAWSPNWTIESSGDYNGDGTADLLMRNSDNSRWRMRLMSGRTILDTSLVGLPLGLNWGAVASSDFDADGVDDILVRNSLNGRWRMYLMNGTTVKETALLSLAVPDFWIFQAASDFTGDGKSDVLVRRADNGLWRLYTMDGTTVADQGLVGLPTNSNWQLESAHDFDGDGRTDALLRNTATQQWQLNLLDGTTVSASDILAIPMNAAFELQVVDDFDGDGDADILIRNTASGQWRLFTIDGTTVVTDTSVPMTTNTAWELVSPGSN